MKRSLVLVVCLCLLTSMVAFADAGIDPLNNEVFTVVETDEIEFTKVDALLISKTEELTEESPYFNLISENRDIEKYPFNDGLKKDIYQYEIEGTTKKYDISALYDIDGEIVYTNPEAELSINPLTYTYNLGYIDVCENIWEEEKIGAYKTLINVTTGDAYTFFVNKSTQILNDGTFFFELNDKFYKATLKNPPVISVLTNGKKVYFDQLPVIENGRTLVPLRAIFESLDATVDWNADTKTITSEKGDTKIVMTIGNSEMTKNGDSIVLDVAPQIIGGRTLVPVRAIAEAFDLTVDWNDSLKQVVIK